MKRVLKVQCWFSDRPESWSVRRGQILGIVCLALSGLLVGCATNASLRGSSDLLGFLVNDQTMAAEVLVKLGQPSARFQSDKILTYRLGIEDKERRYFVVTREVNPQGWPTWCKVKYSLVLVFDEKGVLRKHSLVEVN